MFLHNLNLTRSSENMTRSTQNRDTMMPPEIAERPYTSISTRPKNTLHFGHTKTTNQTKTLRLSKPSPKIHSPPHNATSQSPYSPRNTHHLADKNPHHPTQLPSPPQTHQHRSTFLPLHQKPPPTPHFTPPKTQTFPKLHTN
ncbi:hypothetical protein M758_10G108900 [Ceratodon purpureus]|nr:hypothetical protein M758_10G108900 [Ceratodon purpureus]